MWPKIHCNVDLIIKAALTTYARLQIPVQAGGMMQLYKYKLGASISRFVVYDQITKKYA